MKKYFFAFFIILVLCLYKEVYSRHVGIQKRAINENQIQQGQKYILCKETKSTGVEWRMLQDEYGNSVLRDINIEGIDVIEYNDAISYDNTYVFYVTDKRMQKHPSINSEALTYTVVDWDILYPIKRGGINGWFGSPKYVLKND